MTSLGPERLTELSEVAQFPHQSEQRSPTQPRLVPPDPLGRGSLPSPEDLAGWNHLSPPFVELASLPSHPHPFYRSPVSSLESSL